MLLFKSELEKIEIELILVFSHTNTLQQMLRYLITPKLHWDTSRLSMKKNSDLV